MKNKYKVYLDEHFYYELEMLYLAYKNFKSSGNQYTLNLFIESYLIHLRCLLEFYYSNKSYPDDAKAEQFVDNSETWNTKKKNRDYSIDKADYNRLNQELAHLTWNRIAGKPPEKSWYKVMIETYPKIIEITEIFLSNLKTGINLEKVPKLLKSIKQ